MSEVRGSGREWQAAMAQERLRGATLCPRSGGPQALLPLLTLLCIATNPQGPSALADLATFSSHPAAGQPAPQ